VKIADKEGDSHLKAPQTSQRCQIIRGTFSIEKTISESQVIAFTNLMEAYMPLLQIPIHI